MSVIDMFHVYQCAALTVLAPPSGPQVITDPLNDPLSLPRYGAPGD